MRVWLLTHRLPYAPNRGDRIRAYHMVRFLRNKGAEIDLFSLVHDRDERAQVRLVQDEVSSVIPVSVPKWRNRFRGALRWPTSRPLTLTLLDSVEMRRALAAAQARCRPDVVIAYCSGMAQYALDESLRTAPLVLDMVDVDSEKWRALSATTSSPLKRLLFGREARCLRAFERQAVRAAFATLAVNEREVVTLRSIDPRAAVVAVPNGVELESYRPQTPPQDSSTVVFCGVLDYGPNEEAALRLQEHIWPIVKRQQPDARLLLLGANPTVRLRRACANDPTVHVTGSVPDVRPYLWSSALAAVPLQTARGVQNKVLEAVAAGLPTIVSPAVAAGLPTTIWTGISTARSDAEFAETIVRWLREPAGRRRARAEACNLGALCWDRQLQPLWDVLEAAVRQPTALQSRAIRRRPASFGGRARPAFEGSTAP